jgi:DNA-binding response OmpR family regulator
VAVEASSVQHEAIVVSGGMLLGDTVDAGAHRILVAEDDADIRDLVSDVLEATDYTVVAAEDGSEALSIAHSQSFDLFLIDLNMPRVDGETFCRTYRERGGSTPVILLTAASAASAAAAVEACGAVAYIPKPFQIDELLDIVAAHLP